jgi:hypothetical protein
MSYAGSRVTELPFPLSEDAEHARRAPVATIRCVTINFSPDLHTGVHSPNLLLLNTQISTWFACLKSLTLSLLQALAAGLLHHSEQ